MLWVCAVRGGTKTCSPISRSSALSCAARATATLTAWLHETLPETAAYETVVVAGGDGTLSVAYNALAGRDVTMAAE